MNDIEVPSVDLGQDTSGCWCYQCNREKVGPGGLPISATRMIVCPDCGGKRCPRATDHRHACTGSNAPGQPGSRFEAAAP
jgi:DNA-directed RNA polymerase subunit RPC12/RpoP